jgi:hypothetical protein
MKSGNKNGFKIFIYCCLLIFIFLLLTVTILNIIYVEVPNTKNLNQMFNEKIKEDRICTDYLNQVTHKPIWRLCMLNAFVISFIITSLNIGILYLNGGLNKHKFLYFLVFFTVNLILIFSFTYFMGGWVNYHVVNPKY